MNKIAYAENVATVARDKASMTGLLTEIAQKAKKRGLEINKKTTQLKCGKKRKITKVKDRESKDRHFE